MAFTTWGPVRGCCDHEHDTPEAAEACRSEDAAGCRRQGGYSDRVIREIDAGWRRYDVTRGPGKPVSERWP